MQHDDTAPIVTALMLAGAVPDDPWTVEVRPRRRRIGLSVKRDSTLVIAVPPTADPRRVAAFVAARRDWILRARREMARTAETGPVRKRLVNAENFPLFGRPHRLRLVNTGPEIRTVRTVHGTTELHLHTDHAHDARTIIDWYCRAGLDWLQDRVRQDHHRKAGVADLRFTVREVRRSGSATLRRWGFYTPRQHEVTLAWPLFQLDEDLVEYVLLHELAHAARPGGKPHGHQWQQLMRSYMPNWKTVQETLKRHEPRVWLGDLDSVTS
ncbi:hypothetical protein GCM10012275_42700 [Longimycelium tulufanense]|uniref:YgjP-like metallopeptidase domain-containing protein n=1 Tax=Longimycelium tulufanense TaxID=907463 RepID=A0A8J3CHD2_9PSEU|nr:SprT-like domain-containing protein [Longimycelium tulufanense]GGM67596.1 hypothetical protein GCM10012275_42700 [Longimycelium tulufanense]